MMEASFLWVSVFWKKKSIHKVVAGTQCDHKDTCSVSLVSQVAAQWMAWCMALVEGTVGVLCLGLF